MADYQEIAKRFRDKADEIERNKDSTFGGAFLLVGPDGNSADALIVGQKPDEFMFWGLVKAKVEIALAEADQRQKAQRGYR